MLSNISSLLLHPLQVTKSVLRLTGFLMKDAFNLYKEPAESLRGEARQAGGGLLAACCLFPKNCFCLLYWNLDILNSYFNSETFSCCPRACQNPYPHTSVFIEGVWSPEPWVGAAWCAGCSCAGTPSSALACNVLHGARRVVEGFMASSASLVPLWLLRMALGVIYQNAQQWGHVGTVYSVFLRNRTDFLLSTLK